MDSKISRQLHPLQLLAYAVIILAAMKIAAPVLSLVLLALMLAISVMPLVNWQIKRRIPKGWAIFFTIFLLIITILLLDAIIVAAIYELAEKVPQYKQELYEIKLQAIEFAKSAGIEVPEEMEQSRGDVNFVVKYIREFLTGIVSVFGNLVMVFLLIIFIIIDITNLRQRVEEGEIPSDSSLIQLSGLTAAIRKYLSITSTTGLVTAAGNLVLLIILGVEYPILWAFLSFLFNYIPNIGFVLSVIPPAFLALIEIGPLSAIIVVVGFVVINAAVENIIKPRMMGQELDLTLSLVFLSLIVWGYILGPMGTILAIPLTLAVKMSWDVYIKGESYSTIQKNMTKNSK